MQWNSFKSKSDTHRQDSKSLSKIYTTSKILAVDCMRYPDDLIPKENVSVAVGKNYGEFDDARDTEAQFSQVRIKYQNQYSRCFPNWSIKKMKSKTEKREREHLYCRFCWHVDKTILGERNLYTL